MMTILSQLTTTYSISMLFAAMATLGYVLGRRRTKPQTQCRANTQHEISRAMGVAQELEAIAYRLRKSMAFHVPSIVKFNTQLRQWERSSDVSWHELCDRADELLKPALRLSTEISNAYSELLQQMTQLSTFAELCTDPLTGINNRRALDDSLNKLLATHQTVEGEPLSIAMLDLDYFKRVNDEQGHLTGDRVLQDIAQILRAGIREGDILARYGGEEFAVLMPRTSLRAACVLAERMRAQIADKLVTTVSIGVASSTPGETGTSLIGRADAALYTAKKEGRNCVAINDTDASNEPAGNRVATFRTASVVPPENPLPQRAENPLLAEGPSTIPFYHSEAS